MDGMMEMVDRCLDDYDRDGWRKSHLHSNSDINQLDRLLRDGGHYAE